jgi:predicted nucleic acid-binding protein
MNARTFIDSNVLLYAAEEDSDKSGRAAEWLRHLLRSGTGVTNLQVLNEVTNVLIKRSGWRPEAVFSTIDGYAHFGTDALNRETVAAARLLRFEHNYAWWDCLLLASAIELQCRYFLTEDMQHGHSVRGLTLVNPFLHSPPQTPLH